MKVSIVMATYNGIDFLREQLESFNRQTILPDELIVVDDCSTDDTVVLLNEFRLNSKFCVKIVKNSRNLGSTKSFEKATKIATGDIVLFSDQDDIWESEKIELFIRAFLKDTNLLLAFSNAKLVDENLNDLNKELLSNFRNWNSLSNQYEYLARKTVVTGATMGIRKKLCSYIFPFPCFVVHDAWISYIASSLGNILYIDNSLIKYRQHTKQQIGAIKRISLYSRLYSAMKENYIRRKKEYDYLELLVNKLVECNIANCDAISFWKRKRDIAKNRLILASKSRIRRIIPSLKFLFKGFYHFYFDGYKSFFIDLISIKS